MVSAKHGYDSFFRFNSVPESFDLTQFTTQNGLTRIDSNQLITQNGFLKFDSNRLRLKKPPEYFDQINSRL